MFRKTVTKRLLVCCVALVVLLGAGFGYDQWAQHHLLTVHFDTYADLQAAAYSAAYDDQSETAAWLAAVDINEQNKTVTVYVRESCSYTQTDIRRAVSDSDYTLTAVKTSTYTTADLYHAMWALKDVTEPYLQTAVSETRENYYDYARGFMCEATIDPEAGPRIYACMRVDTDPPTLEAETLIRDTLAPYGDLVVWLDGDDYWAHWAERYGDRRAYLRRLNGYSPLRIQLPDYSELA